MNATQRPSSRISVVSQDWRHTLFAHWRFDATTLEALIPPALTLDRYDGTAWISLVALRVERPRLTALGCLPILPAFVEVNLRTYVTHRGHRGVWFLRIEAATRIGVLVARTLFHAPFHHASLSLHDGPPIACTTAASATAQFVYEPHSNAVETARDPRSEFLMNRLSMFSANTKGQLFRSDIAHQAWALQRTAPEPRVDAAAMFAKCAITVPPEPPICYYANKMPTKMMLPRRV